MRPDVLQGPTEGRNGFKLDSFPFRPGDRVSVVGHGAGTVVKVWEPTSRGGKGLVDQELVIEHPNLSDDTHYWAMSTLVKLDSGDTIAVHALNLRFINREDHPMNTPLVTDIQVQLRQATSDEALVVASMALQMALLRCPKSARDDLQIALRNVLTQLSA